MERTEGTFPLSLPLPTTVSGVRTLTSNPKSCPSHRLETWRALCEPCSSQIVIVCPDPKSGVCHLPEIRFFCHDPKSDSSPLPKTRLSPTTRNPIHFLDSKPDASSRLEIRFIFSTRLARAGFPIQDLRFLNENWLGPDCGFRIYDFRTKIDSGWIADSGFTILLPPSRSNEPPTYPG